VTIKLYAGRGGTGDLVAELEETGAPPGAPCWAESMTNDDDATTVFLTSQFEGAGGYREFHGSGTFDLPGPQPITLVTVRNRADHDPDWPTRP
jgi:hypothetical protein